MKAAIPVSLSINRNKYSDNRKSSILKSLSPGLIFLFMSLHLFAGEKLCPPISYDGSPYCKNDGIATVSYTGNTGGLYTSTTGLSLNSSNGDITLATSTAGTYTVTYTVNGCAASTSITIINNPSPPAVTSPVNYCQSTTAVPLTATGSNLLWGSPTTSVGGINVFTAYNYIDNNYNSRKTNFTTTTPNVTIVSVDYYITPYQAVLGAVLAIYNSSGAAIAISSTSTTRGGNSTTVRIPNIFNYTITAAGNYSIGLYAGLGNIGYDNPVFPITESSGNINITGTSSGNRCFNNIQFSAAPTATAPTPNTTIIGTTNYAVSQTVNGCVSSNATVIVNVNALAAAAISYNGTPFCKSISSAQPVTRTGAAGGIFSSTSGLVIDPSTGAITPATSTAGTYTVTYTMAAAGGCTLQTAVTTVTIAALPAVSYAITESCIGGSTGAITVTASGGTAPYTYSLNAGTYQSLNTFTGLSAGTYTLNTKSAAGCITSLSVIVTAYANSTDNQSAAGTDSWIGHMYDGVSFNSYIGQFTEAENFNELFGGSFNCFNVVSNNSTRSIYTETFSIKYRMNSTKKGLYVVDLGSDDGNRLSIDGTMIYNSWLYQSYSVRPPALINLKGNSSLLYEYFESNTHNQVVFQNLTLVLSNILTTNTIQSYCAGNSGLVISGDTYTVLPSGITLSGSGYQWSYSTSLQGVRINIAGATGATFTPSGSIAPFNTAGTYYIFRNAALSSVNNISPNPYLASNESNVAIITVNPAGQWNGSISTDWSVGGNWCTGAVPSSTTNVLISATATRMPVISSNASCKNLTIETGATLTTSAGYALNIAGTLINNGVMSNEGTTNFNGSSGQQTFSGVSIFNNITLSNTSGLLLPAAITVNNNLLISSGVLNANNFNITVKGNWTNNASATGFTAGTGRVTFNGTTAQLIGGTFATSFNNLTISNTTATVALNSNVLINGNLSVDNGTFDLQGFTANRSSAGGILTVANNAVLRIGGTNSFPSNYSISNLVVASTVEYSGANQTVANQLYGNLVLSSTSGAAVKTFPATALTVVGNLNCTLGSGSSVSFTAASNLTINGNVSIGTATTFNGSSYSHTIGGNWVNNGTFNGNTSTVSFGGPGAMVSGSGNQGFNNLTVSASLVNFSNANIAISGNLATISSGSFSQASGGTFTMSGTGKTINGSGISVDNLTITGTVSVNTSIGISGNLSVPGSFIASTGTITMTGVAKLISGTGTKNFSTLSVAGSITTAVDFIISSALVVNGSLTASAGTATFTGVSSLSGTANLFNLTINGTSLQLSANSQLGIASVLAITAGSLNVTSSVPNIVNFNGTVPQNVNAITYCYLILSNGNTKTASGAITTKYDLVIGDSTVFNPNAYTLSVYGSWINRGAFIPGGSTVEFLGPATASITGATTFNILTSNTSSSTTELTLNDNISVTTVNMIKGIISTGIDTITITGTRTGAGYIYGNIKRTHAFTTGIAYAFEGPDNTITFSAVTSVTSILVSVTRGSINDFPYGNSMSRMYDIHVPTGTYTATFRLHYEEDELNGNDENDMGMWNYDGTQWLPLGKTANSSVANYVEQSGLTNIANRWTCSINPSVVLWNGSVSSDWNTAANWTVYVGGASTPPSSSDVAVLGGIPFTYQPSVSTAVNVKNVVFGSVPLTLTMATGGSLTSGDIQGVWSSNATHTINLNNQNITVNGSLELSDGTNGHAINLNIGNGTLNVLGSLTQSGAANIIFSGSGNLNISDNFNYVNGTFTAGAGTVTYNGIENQAIGAVNYNNLIIDNGAALVAINDPFAINGNLSILAGELDNYAVTNISGDVNIATGATLHNNDMLHVGGNWNNVGNYIGTGAHIKFVGNGTQTISATTFNNLIIDKPVGSSAVLTGDVVINGDLTITSGTFNIKTFNCNRSVEGGTISIADSATFIVGANNSPLNFSNGTLATSSTVIADGTGPQFIFGVEFGNLIFRNAGIKTLVAPILVKGDLTIENGSSFDAGDQTLTLAGNLVNNGTFTPSASTVICTGITKNISGNTTFNRMSVYGSYTFLNDVTINTLLIINPTGALYGGSTIHTIMNGDLINKGILYTLGTTTFTGNVLQTLSLINAVQTVAITVNFNGSVSPVLNSTSPPQYGYLNINNTGGVNPSVGWTVAYALTVGSGASFNGGPSTHNILKNLTNNGTITSSGTLNFAPAAAADVNMGNNFSSSGSVVFGGTGAMTLTGTPAALRNVSISNTNVAGISPGGNWSISKNFTINSNAVFNAGSYIDSVGGNLLNNGTLNSGTSTFVLNGSTDQEIVSGSAFNNLTINKTSGATSLLTNVAVNGILNFVAGNISTGSNKVVLNPSGSVTGSANNTGWVNGNLAKYVGTGISTKQFEIGDATNYTPVTTNFTTVVITGGMLTASTTGGDHPDITASGFDAGNSVNRYWTLTNSSIAPVEYNATFNFIGPSAGAGDIDAGVDTGKLTIKMYDGNWLFTHNGIKRSTSTEAMGMNNFGDFQVATLICGAPEMGSPTITGASCHGTSDGAISINPIGGTEPFAYEWSNGATTQNITNLVTGNYAVTITGSDGCPLESDSITVGEPLAVLAAMSGGNQSLCFNGDEAQTITATATGGTITWYDASTGGNVIVSPVQEGVGSVTYYAEASNGACTSETRTEVTLTINDAPVAPVSGGDHTVCSNGDIAQTLVATVNSTDSITWYNASSGGDIITPEQVGIGSTTYYAEASNGTCGSPSRTAVTLTIAPVLATPGIIMGPVNACPMINSQMPTTYSIETVPGADFYTWHIPFGATMVSGQGTTSIQVIFDSSFELTHSFFSVTAESISACTSAASTLEVLKIIPGIPTAITGPVNICAFMGQPTTAGYSIDPVANATSYTWTVMGAAILVSGQGTTHIEVSYLDTFTTGSIRVTANSNCGNRAPQTLSIKRVIPAAPAAITGPTNACAYIGNSTPVNYSVQPVLNATSYFWTIPSNVTLVSGQGTTSITVMFNSGYTTSLIKVRSVVNCGASGDRSISVAAVAGSTPGVISGPVNACEFIGTGDEVVYSIRKVTNATSYIWTVPNGITITAHPGSTGINDTIIKVTFNVNFVSGTKISVQAVACLPGATRSITLSRVLPPKPGLITGPTNVCPYMVSTANPSGIPVEYSIQSIAGAKTFSWTVPVGATIISHPAGQGGNDTIIRVIFNSDFAGGSVTVAQVNGCGAGIARTLAVSRLVAGTPGSIEVLQTGFCPNRVYTYTLALMPSNSTGIVWSVPTGAVLVAGQNTTSITVSYPSSVVTGTVSARPYNNCSNGNARSLVVKLPVCVMLRGRIVQDLDKEKSISNSTEAPGIRIFPNPVLSNFTLEIKTQSTEDIVIKILDITGNELKRIKTKSITVNIPVDDLKQGIYMVEINQGKYKMIQKFVKL